MDSSQGNDRESRVRSRKAMRNRMIRGGTPGDAKCGRLDIEGFQVPGVC